MNLADDDPFYHAFPEILLNEDIEKWINIEDDNEVLGAIVVEKMEKDASGKNEICVASFVSKDVEMTPVGNSLSENEVLSHLSEPEITAYNAKVTT